MNILIEATGHTPRIFEENDELYVWGTIVPENPIEIFTKFNNIAISKYNETGKLHIHFSLGYFNTSSARFLYNFFRQFKGKESIEISWHYEADDEDILESGKEFEEISGLKFNFIDSTFNANGQ